MGSGGGEDVERVGVVAGRFQVFHNDHLRYLGAARQRCDRLVIGITSPERQDLVREVVDPGRGRVESNPMTYYERLRMISTCLRAEGWSATSFDIVPFPIEQMERLDDYAPLEATYFLTVYDAWGKEKADRLARSGRTVEILWTTADKGLSGTDIRLLMARDGAWLEMVPPTVRDFVLAINLPSRLRNMSANSGDDETRASGRAGLSDEVKARHDKFVDGSGFNGAEQAT